MLSQADIATEVTNIMTAQGITGFRALPIYFVLFAVRIMIMIIINMRMPAPMIALHI